MTLILAGLGLVIALTVATGYFVAQEFAYVAVDRSRLRGMAEQGSAGAARAIRITERLSFVLSGAQLGITITAILAGYVAEPFIGQGLESLLEQRIPEALSAIGSILVAMLLATSIQMILGELAPKNWAIAQPERLAIALSRSTLLYLQIAGPVVRVFDAAATRLLRLFNIEPIEELESGATASDLEHIIAASDASGLLDPGTTRLLNRGLKFRSLRVRQAMVPRVDVIAIDAMQPASVVVDLLDTGHTQFPLLDDTGELTGVIGISDLLDVEPALRKKQTAASVARPPVIIPDVIPLSRALEQMRTAHNQFGCVVDEHGSFVGVVTLEDIAEELVGAIRDEDDLAEPEISQNADGSWSVPGGMRLDEVGEATGVMLPEGPDYETMSGLVLSVLGRVPVSADQMVVQTNGQPVEIEVVSVDHNVPSAIVLRPAHVPTEADA